MILTRAMAVLRSFNRHIQILDDGLDLGLNGNWGVVPPTAAMFRSPVVELKYVPNDRSKLYATAGSDPEPP